MHITDAQREIRSVYLGGSVGTFVSGVIWLISAALGTWVSTSSAIFGLVIGGMFIFPVTMLVLKAMARKASLSRENPLGQLATQVALTIPLAYPVIGAAAVHNINWFYPAFMVIVGAHYLPFVFLYGMWIFGVLAGLMVAGGWFVANGAAQSFTQGGWITGVMLVLFSLPIMLLGRERARGAS
jgi:hypothetical protein